MDEHANIYVTGQFILTATFGPGESNETTLVSGGNTLFVAKYDSGGVCVSTEIGPLVNFPS